MSRLLFIVLLGFCLLSQSRGENKADCDDPDNCVSLNEAKGQGLSQIDREFEKKKNKLYGLLSEINEAGSRVAASDLSVVVEEMKFSAQDKLGNHTLEKFLDGMKQQKQSSFFLCVADCASRGEDRLSDTRKSCTKMMEGFQKRMLKDGIKRAEDGITRVRKDVEDFDHTYKKKILACTTKSCVTANVEQALKDFGIAMDRVPPVMKLLDEMAHKYGEDLLNGRELCNAKFEDDVNGAHGCMNHCS